MVRGLDEIDLRWCICALCIFVRLGGSWTFIFLNKQQMMRLVIMQDQEMGAVLVFLILSWP